MKKFEQPVVALNEMMMSESIASICCYSKSVQGDAWGVSQTIINVLNGGYISGGADASKRYQIKTDILRELGGVIPAPTVHYKAYYWKEINFTFDNNFSNPEAAYGGIKVPPATNTFDVVRFARGGTDGKNLTYLSYVTSDGIGTLDEAQMKTTYVSTNNQICSHDHKDCPWVESTSSGGETAGWHYGATTAHATGGQKWWEGHPAQQYAS